MGGGGELRSAFDLNELYNNLHRFVIVVFIGQLLSIYTYIYTNYDIRYSIVSMDIIIIIAIMIIIIVIKEA